MASNTVDLFVRLRDVAQAQAGLRSLSNEVIKSKQEQKRASLENQVLANKEKLQVQEMRVEMAKRQAIIRGSHSDIARSIQAQNAFNQSLRQQNVLRQRLTNFDSEMAQTGSTGWDSLRKILQGSLNPGMSSLLGNVGSVGTAFQGLGSTGMLAMGALTAGIGVALVGAIGLAQVGIQELNTAFQKSLELSDATISATTAFSRDFGIDRASARKAVIENQIAVEQSAKALPIGSGDINRALSIAQNSGILALTEGDKDFFQKRVIGNAQDVGVLSQLALLRQQLGSQITEPQYAQAIATISSKDSSKADLNTEFFRTSGLGKRLNELGFSSATGKQRLEILSQAITQLVPLEAVKEQQQTIGAQFSSFYDNLFAPRTGVFGFLRELGSGGNVMQEVERSVSLIFGQDGTLSRLAQVFGGTGDVMEDLKSLLVGLNETVKGVNDILKVFEKTPVDKAAEEKYREERTKQSEAFQKYHGREENFFEAMVGSFFSAVKTEATRPFWVPQVKQNYQGLIQSFQPAYSGFSSAYSTEFRNKPPGTSIGLLYNSGEDILPPGMLQSFLQGAYSQGTRQGQAPIITIAEGAIQVTSLPGQDPLVIANYTIDLLMNRLREELAT
jgi:hypothetical protein